MAERGVDFIMEILSRLPMHLPQWLAVHLPQWRVLAMENFGARILHPSASGQQLGALVTPKTGLQLQPLRRHWRSANRSHPGGIFMHKTAATAALGTETFWRCRNTKRGIWRPRISFFWFRNYQASSPRLALWNGTHIDAALVGQLGDCGDLGSQIFAAAGRGSLGFADLFAALDRGDLGLLAIPLLQWSGHCFGVWDRLAYICPNGVFISMRFGGLLVMHLPQ